MTKSQDVQGPLSIYQNLLQAGKDYYFLSGIDTGGQEAAKMLVESLFHKKFSDPLSPGLASTDHLRHFFFESRNYEKLSGVNPLGMGFPLLSIPNEEPRLLPLLIWRIEMEAMGPKPDTWILRFNDKPTFRLNPELLDLIPENERKKWADFRNIDGAAVQSEIESLAKKIKAVCPESVFDIQGINSLETLWEKEELATILPEGIIGLFKPYPRDSRMEDREIPETEKADLHHISIPAIDGRQASVLHNLETNNGAFAESFFPERLEDTAHNLISNRLSNGKSCIFISKKVPRLVSFQRKLQTFGLDKLSVVIRNPRLDGPLLEKLLQSLPFQNLKALPKNSFKVLKTRHKRLYSSLQKQYKILHGPYLNNWDWQELCGQFIRSRKIAGRELLDRFLDPENYAWNSEEYHYLLDVLEKAHKLYTPLGTLKHPLTDLHPAVFIQETPDGAQAIAEAGLSSWKQKLETLHAELLTFTNKYALQLTNTFEQHYQKLQRESQGILDSLDEYKSRFGSYSWDKSIPSSLAGALSKEKKESREKLLEIRNKTLKLEQNIEDSPISIENVNPKFRRVRDLKDNLDAFQENLRNWRSKLTENIEEEVQRLSSRNVHPVLQNKLSPLQLEEEMDQFLQTVNESNWLAKPLNHRMLSLPQRQKHLEKIIETLDTIKLNLRDFQAFYNWQKFWLQLPDNAQKLVEALVKVKAKNWEAAFNSWYFHQSLNRLPHSKMPLHETDIREYYDTYESLKEILPGQIQHYWQQESEKNQRKIRSGQKKLLKELASGSGLSEVRFGEILEDLSTLLFSRFPLLLISSDQAVSSFSRLTKAADSVIIWDDGSLTEREINQCKELGRDWLILRETGYPKPENSIDLPGRTTPSPFLDWKKDRIHWNVAEVLGQFDAESGINDSEARLVIQLLNEIRQTPQRTFPKVAILTLNTAQRNRIASYLLEIKQSKGTGWEKIQQLERNGLSVLTLEELSGQSFDQLFFSCQIGTTTNKPDAFLEWMDSEAGSKQLRQLLRFQNLLFIHSLPKEFLEGYADYRPGGGQQLLCGMLNLAKAKKQQDPSEEEKWFNTLFHASLYIDPFNTLEEEIRESIKHQIDESRIMIHPDLEGIQIPVFIHSDQEKIKDVAILPDIFLNDTAAPSLAQEAQIWHKLEKHYTIIPVWSVDWWRNPVLEARKLSRQLEDYFHPVESSVFEEEE
ncbi:MAG: hypothetical protein GYB31_20520 [Bacteroidetes bacterium]|nr:hypothetical protein [Bacteroidota bacterium]